MSRELRGAERSSEFSTALRMLEGEGLAMLVVGDVDGDAMRVVLQQLLGAPEEDRVRILGLLNDTDPGDYLPDSVSPDQPDVRTLQFRRGRSAATTDHSVTQLDGVDGDQPLRTAVHQSLLDAYAELARPPSQLQDSRTAGFRPDELRVVVDSLRPLLDSMGREEIVDWLRNDPLPAIRDPRYRGRAHWVYYGARDEPVVETLMADPELFDVLIEVRRYGRHVEYRWILYPDRFPHIADRLETPWLAVTE